LEASDKLTDPRYPNSRAEVHVDRLHHNLKVLRGGVADAVSSMAVVKADAYGHGAVSLARRLTDRVEWFAVANVDEAIELREAGIENSILVFGAPTGKSAGAYRKYNLVATVSAFEHFDYLQKNTRYHLNFDTGMGRYGFLPEQTSEVKTAVQKNSHLIAGGIYSHFATADEPHSDKVHRQLDCFREIRSQFSTDLLTHMANSGGAAFYKQSHLDMIRYGIGLYGYDPGPVKIDGLQPVMDWKSFLAQVKPIRKGMTVSYRATWQAPYDGYLGVVPVGYADGLPRNLSHKLEVLIDDTAYPVVGIVTMDNIMVFLGEDQLKSQTEVRLFGKDGFTAQDWAEKVGSISYEILARLTPRVKRVYVD
jgi:alanine racemase